MPNDNGNGNGTNGRFLKNAYALIAALFSILLGILSYLYHEQNKEIESLRHDFTQYKKEIEIYKTDHEKDKFQILLDLNTDLTDIKSRLGIDRKSTSRK